MTTDERTALLAWLDEQIAECENHIQEAESTSSSNSRSILVAFPTIRLKAFQDVKAHLEAQTESEGK